VVKVFKDSGRSCPVFTDKHLSYDWKKAKQMYDWSRELKFPLMAGSSVPVTFRRPADSAGADGSALTMPYSLRGVGKLSSKQGIPSRMRRAIPVEGSRDPCYILSICSRSSVADH